MDLVAGGLALRRFRDYGTGPLQYGHRLVLYCTGGAISVSCACLKGSVDDRPRWCPPLDTRRRWTAPEIGLVFAGHVLYGDVPEVSR